jgi:hypothetical protein
VTPKISGFTAQLSCFAKYPFLDLSSLIITYRFKDCFCFRLDQALVLFQTRALGIG